MTKPDQPSQKPRRWLKGCALLLLFFVGLFAWAFWQIGEPNRRAQAVHQAIHPGMSVLEVEKLLTGRYFCNYLIDKGSGWEIVTREVFAKTIAAPSPSGPLHTRLQLTFLGMAPGRVSFAVQADGAGRITAVDQPRGWD